jgi:hypothetical protein
MGSASRVPSHGQEAHDVGDRVLGHEAAEDEHAEEGQHAPISDSTERNCWSKPSSSIIHQV